MSVILTVVYYYSTPVQYLRYFVESGLSQLDFRLSRFGVRNKLRVRPYRDPCARTYVTGHTNTISTRNKTPPRTTTRKRGQGARAPGKKKDANFARDKVKNQNLLTRLQVQLKPSASHDEATSRSSRAVLFTTTACQLAIGLGLGLGSGSGLGFGFGLGLG